MINERREGMDKLFFDQGIVESQPLLSPLARSSSFECEVFSIYILAESAHFLEKTNERHILNANSCYCIQ